MHLFCWKNKQTIRINDLGFKSCSSRRPDTHGCSNSLFSSQLCFGTEDKLLLRPDRLDWANDLSRLYNTIGKPDEYVLPRVRITWRSPSGWIYSNFQDMLDWADLCPCRESQSTSCIPFNINKSMERVLPTHFLLVPWRKSRSAKMIVINQGRLTLVVQCKHRCLSLLLTHYRSQMTVINFMYRIVTCTRCSSAIKLQRWSLTS